MFQFTSTGADLGAMAESKSIDQTKENDIITSFYITICRHGNRKPMYSNIP